MPCRCCDSTLQIGCIDNCGLLIFNISGTTAGDIFMLEVDYLGAKKRLFSEIQTDGDVPFFDMRELNENYSFTGQLYRNDIAIVLVDTEAKEYDCVSFTTVFAMPAQNKLTEQLTIL